MSLSFQGTTLFARLHQNNGSQAEVSSQALLAPDASVPHLHQMKALLSSLE